MNTDDDPWWSDVIPDDPEYVHTITTEDVENEAGLSLDEAIEVVRERDGRECQHCGVTEDECTSITSLPYTPSRLDTHHLIPIRKFPDPEQAHDPRNMVVVCRKCHRRLEGLPAHIQLQRIGIEWERGAGGSGRIPKSDSSPSKHDRD